MGSGKGEEACSPSAAFFFLLAMVAGVGIQVTQKTLFQLKVEGRTGEIEPFTPKALTLLFMFCSMSLALPIHVFVNKESTGLTPKRVLMLGVPTVFDLITTALGTLTVQFLPLSTNSLLRGSVTIFVAIQKHFVLKDRLSSANWVGIGLISCAVLIVGVVGIVTSDNTSAGGTQTALLGVVLAFLSTFVASFQFVVQEKLMSELDTPPLVLCGCMGLAGVVLTLCVVYPAYYHLPGDDHGRFEDFYNTWHKFSRSPFIQLLLGIYRRRPLSSLVHPLAPPLAPSLTPLELFNSVLVLTLNASMLIVMQARREAQPLSGPGRPAPHELSRGGVTEALVVAPEIS